MRITTTSEQLATVAAVATYTVEQGAKPCYCTFSQLAGVIPPIAQ